MKRKKHPVSRVAIKWTKKKNPPMMDPWETDLLIKYIKKCKIHFIEIGTHRGGSASLISTYLPREVKMTTIDIFRKAPKGSMQPKGISPSYKKAKETIKKQGDISKVDIIKGYSGRVAKKWDKKIDILFIDGDHRYKAVKKDFTSWESHLVRGGFILMHDVNFKGVKRALTEILLNRRFSSKEKVGELVVIKKLG